ncbi:MAG: O-antigen/teichoic acid export membrane protein [Pseudohongiellaceae bacterium]
MLLVGTILSRGVGMFLIPLYTGVLSKEMFLIWGTMQLGAGFVSTVSSHGMTAALMWKLKTGGEGGSELQGAERHQAISAAIGWAMLAAVVVCGGAAAAAGPVSRLLLNEGGNTYGTTLAMLFVAQGLRIVTYPAEGVLKLRFQSVPIVLMSFGEFFVQLVGTVLALTVFDLGLFGMAAASLLAAVLRLLLGLYYLPEMRKPRLDWKTVQPLVRYGLPLMPGAIAGTVLSLSDRWFFNLFDMKAEGGLYEYGDKWAKMIELAILPLIGMWPAVYFNIAKDDDAPRQFGRIATLWAGGGGCIAFMVTMIGPTLTDAFDTSVNREFAGASAAIGVLSAGYVCLGLIEVARVGFSITARTRRTAIAMVTAALVNLGLNAWLIPIFGAMGAAWATMIAYAMATFCCLVLTRSIYPQEWEWGRLAHVAILLVGGAWLVDAYCPPSNLLGSFSWMVGAFGDLPERGALVTLRLPAALGALPRLLVAVAIPCLLLLTGFLHREERRGLLATLEAKLGLGPKSS